MASIEEGLVAFVEANVASAGQGFPVQVPQDCVYPAWSYQVMSDEESLAHDGALGWYKLSVTLIFISRTYALSKAAANALRAALGGYHGLMGSRSVQFCKCRVSDGWADVHNLPAAVLDVEVNYV